MQNNPKKRSYSEALAINYTLDRAQDFNNRSRGRNLNYSEALNIGSQGLPPYRQITNFTIQEELFNKVLGAIKGLQFLARNQIVIERQNNFLIYTDNLNQKPSSSIFNSKSNHMIDLHKLK